MPPTTYVSSDAYPAWYKSVNLAVFAHTNGQLVEFSLLMEKPAGNTYWRLVLETYQGTNKVARSSLGYDLLGPPLTSRMSNTNLAKKTLQTFSFSLSREMITNSMIYFVQFEDHDPGRPDLQDPWAQAVRLLDLYSSAENDQAPVQPRVCEELISAINREDWHTLRTLAKPGMMANEYIRMWENSARAGHPVRVGTLLSSDKNHKYLDGKLCTMYSFVFDSTDAEPRPHQLQVLVREDGGKSTILDFWNLGW
jgi:hypothetical protein